MKWTPLSTLMLGGAGLSLGASAIEALPANAASAGVKGGLSQAGQFFPVMGTIGGGGLAFNQLKQLRKLR